MTDVQHQVNRSWQQYTIMHLDRRVASIRSDGTCTIYAASFMPYNLYLEPAKDMDARVNNLNNFYFLWAIPIGIGETGVSWWTIKPTPPCACFR